IARPWSIVVSLDEILDGWKAGEEVAGEGPRGASDCRLFKRHSPSHQSITRTKNSPLSLILQFHTTPTLPFIPLLGLPLPQIPCAMKKWILALMFTLTIASLAPVSASAQCSICTRTAQQLGEKPAKGLNGGIIYLA